MTALFLFSDPIMPLDSLLQPALAIAIQAGDHLRQFYQQDIAIHNKADNTPVTNADLFLSQFLTEQLSALTPDIPILSEENCNIPFSQRQHWQRYWLIDPLDGTQQFIDHTDQFAVVICLVAQNQPVLGIIHAPILQKTYYALKNQGAFLLQHSQRIALNRQALRSSILRIAVGSSHRASILNSLQAPYQANFFQYGSSSLKAGLVAEGKADCYVRFGDTGEWDTAAAEILLAESGGKIFDLQFQPLTYNQRPSLVNPYFVMVADSTQNWQQIFQFNSR